MRLDFANLDSANKRNEELQSLKDRGILPDFMMKDRIEPFRSDLWLLAHELGHGPDFFDPYHPRTVNEAHADVWADCVAADCAQVPGL